MASSPVCIAHRHGPHLQTEALHCPLAIKQEMSGESVDRTNQICNLLVIEQVRFTFSDGHFGVFYLAVRSRSKEIKSGTCGISVTVTAFPTVYFPQIWTFCLLNEPSGKTLQWCYGHGQTGLGNKNKLWSNLRDNLLFRWDHYFVTQWFQVLSV